MYSTIHQYKYYKVKLYDLNDEQIEKAKLYSKVSAILYNFGIEFVQYEYQNHRKYPKFFGLCEAMRNFVNQDENRWMKQVPAYTRAMTMKILDGAFQRFFKKQAKFPKPKKIDNPHYSFSIQSDSISFHKTEKNLIRIPGLSGKYDGHINAKQHHLPIDKESKHNFKNARIKYDGINWWLCISFKLDANQEPIETPTGEGFGIDVGLRTAAYLSNGRKFDFPYTMRIKTLLHRKNKLRSAIDKYKNMERKKQERSSSHDENREVQIPISNRQMKRINRYRKTCRQITNIYHTFYHTVSRRIADMYPEWICIETLQVKEIQHNNKRNSANMHEARLSGFLDMIDYKCREHGTKIIRAPKSFPSSQICSKCGNKHKVGSNETYICPNCGLEINRDLNAALNLKKYGIDNPTPYM